MSLFTRVPLRATMIAASAFAIWHSGAMLVAPFPQGELRARLYPLVEGYLTLAYLDHRWTFFGPRPGTGRLLRYSLTTADGSGSSFLLTESLLQGDPAFFRYARLYDAVSRREAGVVASTAAYLCRQHASLRPTAVTFQVRHQILLRPEDVRAGVRPWDDVALWDEWLEPAECP